MDTEGAARVQPTILVVLFAVALAAAAAHASPTDAVPPDIVIPVPPRLDASCVVSVLNRTARVQSDGTWRLDNVPASFGEVRARASCMADGKTASGQSTPFVVPNNGVVTPSDIDFEALVPTPLRLQVNVPVIPLTATGATLQLSVSALYSDGATQDVSASSLTTYTSSNPNIVTVGPSGLATAVSSGTVIVTVLHEALSGFARITVALSSADSDGDGINDDIESQNGMNPNDPVDALEDFDGDGLTNADELSLYATPLRDADGDDDGIRDGEEIVAGADGFATNPLLADTDGDGVRDALEVQTGSDPTNPNSFNLAQALASLEVQPLGFVLTVNPYGATSPVRQLSVIGHLIDGRTIDLTATSRGTGYASSNLNSCNFGITSGEVGAGANGSCILTVTNSGLSATTFGIVRTFVPQPLSSMAIPGFGNNVEVVGDYAFIAAGASGLQVVDVSNRRMPVIVASLDTPGTATDVRIDGTTAFIADGSAGLRLIDVSNPLAPVEIGSVDTPGMARDVVVRGTKAFVADDLSGLRLVDVSIPSAPQLAGTVDAFPGAFGVSASQDGTLAVVTGSGQFGLNRLYVVDTSDAQSPSVSGSLLLNQNDARDVEIRDNYAFVADFAIGVSAYNISNPAAPTLVRSTPVVVPANDVALAGNLGLYCGREVSEFRNWVAIAFIADPTTSMNHLPPLNHQITALTGIGIAVDATYAYHTAAYSFSNKTASGQSFLYIGNYMPVAESPALPPSVVLSEPADGAHYGAPQQVVPRATAGDNTAVAGVAFLVNGRVIGVDTTAPYQSSYITSVGMTSAAFHAVALDLDGITTASSVATISIGGP